MSRPYNNLTLKILEYLQKKGETPAAVLHKAVSPTIVYKEFYNTLFRMAETGLITKASQGPKLTVSITSDGRLLFGRKQPTRDNIWKLVIFDIPEKHQKVRHILRAKLKQLGFKKWQNSIYASPYSLDEEIIGELNDLGKKFFVRLIRTTDINHTQDLEKLFSQ